MNQKQYEALVAKITAGWPSDRYEIIDPQKIILTCEHGGFIKVARTFVEDKADLTPEIVAMFDNKLLIQYTEDLEAGSYKNLGYYIHKGSLPENPRMVEALKELQFRIQIGDILG